MWRIFLMDGAVPKYPIGQCSPARPKKGPGVGATLLQALHVETRLGAGLSCGLFRDMHMDPESSEGVDQGLRLNMLKGIQRFQLRP